MLRLTALLLLVSATASASLVDDVDPFIGTGGHGHTYPGATLPFGMVQLSPDTRLTGWDGCSGYHYDDDVVYGFSHTHLSGTGVSDYGDVLFMPVSGELFLDNGAVHGAAEGYASHFDKGRELAEPGYYRTWLTDYEVEVELSATARAGLHRYRFPAGHATQVVLDLEHRDLVLDSQIAVVNETEIVGFRRSSAWATDQVVYFCAQFSRPFGVRLVQDDRFVADADTITGTACKAVLDFGNGGGEVMIRVGISAVDVEGARRNVEQEIPRFSFPTVRRQAREAWSAALDRFAIEGASPEQRTIFATALYHSFLAPNLFSDVDGRYRGMDGQVHTAEDRDQYTVFSLWDTYRATHPLFTLVEPDRTRDFLQTFLAQYREGGRLPVWELAGNETDCMIGYHAVSVIADAWAKGLRTEDGEALLEAMLDSAGRNHFGLRAYRNQGFIAIEDESESVSKTLEYGYDDWCIARMASMLGHAETADRFDRRAQAWRHLFDPKTTFLRPRQNGGWLTPYDPRRVDFNHTEANGWQYRFAVPQDLGSFIEALGGDQRFVAALDSMFETDSATTGRDQPDITGRIGQYAHGNEPSHHIAWLYHYAGRPDRSAARVEQIRSEMYRDAPDGLIGNEDCGQMSSWYVFAALGLYPVVPGRPEYVIVPPQFASASVQLDSTTSFTVRREGSGAYVRSATLAGAPLQRSWIGHDEITRGGELVVQLGDAPSDWGTAPDDRPRSRIEVAPIVPAPWIEAPAMSFRDSMVVRARSAERSARFAWSSGERTSDADSFVVRESGTVSLTARSGDGRPAPRVSARYWRIPHQWSVQVLSTPNAQYTAGGPEALVDLRRGTEDWRTGAWQGYEGQDFVATVDFGEPVELSAAGAGFLQDQRSWILMPVEVVFEASLDGDEFDEIGRATHQIGDRWPDPVIEDLTAEFDPVEARFLRVRARNYGVLPAWHPGAGGDSFIFVDEILATTAAPDQAP